MRGQVHRGQSGGLEKRQACSANGSRRSTRPSAASGSSRPRRQAINDLPVSAIDTGLVLKVLEPIWKMTPETASRVRGRIELVLDWAKVRGYRDGENLRALERPPRPDASAAIEGEIRQASRRRVLRRHANVYGGSSRKGRRITARALEFTILTAARSGETLDARWSRIRLAGEALDDPGSSHEGRPRASRAAFRSRA